MGELERGWGFEQSTRPTTPDTEHGWYHRIGTIRRSGTEHRGTPGDGDRDWWPCAAGPITLRKPLFLRHAIDMPGSTLMALPRPTTGKDQS
jgi:hypothetical protein